MFLTQLPDNTPQFIDTVAGIYRDALVIHPSCDVYWQFEGRWIQLLLIYPYSLGENIYRAVGFDGEQIECYLLHKTWYCRVLWSGE